MAPTRRQIVPGSLDAQRLTQDLTTTTQEVPTLAPPSSSSSTTTNNNNNSSTLQLNTETPKDEITSSLLQHPKRMKQHSSLNIDQPTPSSSSQQPNYDPSSSSSSYSTHKANKINHWRNNEYATGCVEPTWSDEVYRPTSDDNDVNGPNRTCCADATSEEIDPTCGCLMVSGYVCGSRCINAKRIGNMAVLLERNVVLEVPSNSIMEDRNDNGGEGKESSIGEGEEEKALVLSDMEEGTTTSSSSSTSTIQRITQRQIIYVVGPYWPMLLCVTYPLIFSVSIWTAYKAVFVPKQYPLIMLGWTILTFGLISSLFHVGFKDPGIMRRYREPPTSIVSGNGSGGDVTVTTSGRMNTSWRWNDQAQTYRPRNAFYDPDCAVVVEEFDHTCPWTGTAIGKKNLKAFHSFVCLVFTCLIMDILLLTSAVGVIPHNNYY